MDSVVENVFGAPLLPIAKVNRFAVKACLEPKSFGIATDGPLQGKLGHELPFGTVGEGEQFAVLFHFAGKPGVTALANAAVSGEDTVEVGHALADGQGFFTGPDGGGKVALGLEMLTVFNFSKPCKTF